MTYIDDFIKNKEGMNRMDKLFGNYPTVRSTSSISDDIQYVQLGDQSVMESTFLYSIFPFFVLLVAGLFWVLITNSLLHHPSLGFLYAFLFMTFIMYTLLNSIFNPKYYFTITVNQEGIRIKKTMYYWTDITETGIMTKNEGRNKNSWLLIFKKDTPVEKFDLAKFVVSERALATVIEYYKAKATATNNLTATTPAQ